jgi:hypothetical protein
MTTRRREQPLNTEPPRASRIAAKVADENQSATLEWISPRLFYTFKFFDPTGMAGKVTTIEGDTPKRVALQQWDSMEKLQAYRNDPKFKELRQIGDKYAKFRSYAVEGVAQ